MSGYSEEDFHAAFGAGACSEAAFDAAFGRPDGVGAVSEALGRDGESVEAELVRRVGLSEAAARDAVGRVAGGEDVADAAFWSLELNPSSLPLSQSAARTRMESILRRVPSTDFWAELEAEHAAQDFSGTSLREQAAGARTDQSDGYGVAEFDAAFGSTGSSGAGGKSTKPADQTLEDFDTAFSQTNTITTNPTMED